MEKTESLQLPLLSKSSTKDARYIYYNNIAILISTTSFFYNILEGAVSVYFGEVNDSLSLFFFGVQSFVEVLSSVIVIWKVMTSYVENKHQIKIEKRATIFIGCLFIFLSIGILITGILSIINREYPTTTIPNIIVSAVATTIMLVLWLFKKKLAKELNSSTIQSDAQCSLACMRITIFLLIGSTIFHFWNEVWWIDGAMSLALGILFGKEGIQMLKWASSKDFNGGCCGGCGKLSVKVVPQKEYYGIQDEESVLQTEAPTAVKKGDGCCNKEGKCTKSAQGKNSALTEATQAIPEASFFQKTEILEQKPQQEAQPKKGGCCKGGGCTKNVTSQQTAPVEVIQVIPQVSLSQETQPIKTPGSCCKGGKCSKKEQKEALNEPIPEVSLTINENQVLTSPIIEEAPLQKPPGNCCKGGKCSKKTNENQNPTTVETVQVMPEVSLSQEAQPTKTPGSCCKGGKCSKKEQKPPQNEDIAEVSLTINENQVLISPQPALTEEVGPVKSAGSCCKGGKCSKKAAEAISTRDQTEVSSLQSQLNESEVRA